MHIELESTDGLHLDYSHGITSQTGLHQLVALFRDKPGWMLRIPFALYDLDQGSKTPPGFGPMFAFVRVGEKRPPDWRAEARDRRSDAA